MILLLLALPELGLVSHQAGGGVTCWRVEGSVLSEGSLRIL